MEKVIRIDGMMCPHCEARVKKALEASDAVSSAVVSHVSGTATVTLLKDISDGELTKIVTDSGYDVVGIR